MNASAWGHFGVGGRRGLGWYRCPRLLVGCQHCTHRTTPGRLEHLISLVQPRWPSWQRSCLPDLQPSLATLMSVSIWLCHVGECCRDPGVLLNTGSPWDTQCPHGCALCPHGRSQAPHRPLCWERICCQALDFPLHPVGRNLGMELGQVWAGSSSDRCSVLGAAPCRALGTWMCRSRATACSAGLGHGAPGRPLGLVPHG